MSGDRPSRQVSNPHFCGKTSAQKTSVLNATGYASQRHIRLLLAVIIQVVMFCVVQVWHEPSRSRLKHTPTRWWLYGTAPLMCCSALQNTPHPSTCGEWCCLWPMDGSRVQIFWDTHMGILGLNYPCPPLLLRLAFTVRVALRNKHSVGFYGFISS